MPNFEQCDRPVNHQKQFSGGGFFFVHSLERTVSFERKERDVPKKVFNAAVLVHSVYYWILKFGIQFQLKFIYSEKATKFCEIFPFVLYSASQK